MRNTKTCRATMICDLRHLQTDFFLLRDGPVLVMSDRELLQAGVRWLRDARGYKHHGWLLQSEAGFHEEVSNTFSWKQQFGYSPWNGNLDALSDGAISCEFVGQERVVISIDNAERLKNWFGKSTVHIWDILQEAARMQLIFGVGLLVVVNTSSSGEAVRWAKMPRVCLLTRKNFPGAHLARDAGLVTG